MSVHSRVETRSADDGTLEITWDRAESANAFDEQLVGELLSALTIASSPPPKVLVLRGAGGRFSAGFDLQGDNDDRSLAWRFARAEQALATVRRFPAVTVACVEGPAFGLGADLVVACDYRVGDDSARFRFPGPRFGVVLGTDQLRQRVGASRATDILLRNEVVGSETAHRDGLLTHLLHPAEHREFVERLAADVGDLDGTTLRSLLSVLRTGDADSSLASLVRSTHQDGLADRVEGYRRRALRSRTEGAGED